MARPDHAGAGLYHRFYRLPNYVKVTMLKGTNKLDGNRQFEPIPARLRYFERYETVAAPGGIQIHYLYDAPYNKETGSTGHNQSIKGSIASAVSTAAVIYKDEMYDVRKGRNWTFDAPIFGIPFGAKHISIHIEIPENYPVLPEGYRQALRYRAGEFGTFILFELQRGARFHHEDTLWSAEGMHSREFDLRAAGRHLWRDGDDRLLQDLENR